MKGYFCIPWPNCSIIVIKLLLLPPSHRYWSYHLWWFPEDDQWRNCEVLGMLEFFKVPQWSGRWFLSSAGIHVSAKRHGTSPILPSLRLSLEQFWDFCLSWKCSSLFSHHDLVAVLRARTDYRHLLGFSRKSEGSSSVHQKQNFCHFEGAGWGEGSSAPDIILPGRGGLYGELSSGILLY